MTPSSFTRAYVAHDLGGDLHRLAQRAAVVAAALYVAGLAVGVVIHWANDWLSGDRRPWPVAWGVVTEPQPAPIVAPAAAESILDQASPELRRAVAKLRLCDPGVTMESLYLIAKSKGITEVNRTHLCFARRDEIIAAILDNIK
jgi:hypothetical protein